MSAQWVLKLFSNAQDDVQHQKHFKGMGCKLDDGINLTLANRPQMFKAKCLLF